MIKGRQFEHYRNQLPYSEQQEFIHESIKNWTVFSKLGEYHVKLHAYSDNNRASEYSTHTPKIKIIIQ